MGILLKTHKILWGRSGNQCAICGNELIVDSAGLNDDPSIIGDEAHIIARKESFTRGDYDSLAPEQRDHYSNLILLCKTHHKQIDDQPNEFTVERLRGIKKAHEDDVRSRRTAADNNILHNELIYSAYIDEWQRLSDLDNWLNISSFLTSPDALLSRAWYDNQKKFLIWIIGRIWPNDYLSLEEALHNYQFVLMDFLLEYDKHILYESRESEYLETERFYRIREFDEARYHRLAHQYEEHITLVNDLFFELTRAANYICDKVRDTLFRGYRIQEGALLIVRSMVGFDMKTEHVRLEYRGAERTLIPYPGLDIFKKIRYTTRDYAISPDEPKLPLDKNDA